MRAVFAWLAVIGLAGGTPGCVWKLDDSEVRCDSKGQWPRCSPDGDLIDCDGGSIHMTSCAQGWVCMSWQGDDRPMAACALPDSAPCDPNGFEPICAAEDAVWKCSPLGVTYKEACSTGQACTASPQHTGCTWPSDVACDPDEPDPFCDGDSVAYCDQDQGVIVHSRDCGPDQTCMLGARGPVCAHPEAEACDPEAFVEQCAQLEDSEAIVDCDPFDQLTRVRPCEADERCRNHGSDARCFGPDQPDCDPDAFETACEGADKLICNQFGVEELIVCPADEPCRVGGTGPRCISPDAAACDPAGFVPTCDGADKVYCSGTSGFTYAVACEAGLICVPDADPWSWTGLACVDPQSPACDEPGTFACDGTQVVFCSGGYETVHDCEPQMVCVADEEFWLCLPADATDCDPAVFEDGCDGDTAQVCFGQPGKVVEWACTEPLVCVVSDEGPVCQQP